MILYKLTTQDNLTRPGYFNETLWGPDITHAVAGEGELCGPGWIHAYEHPLLAVILNPIHAVYQNPKLWEAEGEVGIRDGQLKVGCKKLTTVKEIDIPKVTTEQLVTFAIKCAIKVYSDEKFLEWANNWLSGKDRSLLAASVAARAACAEGYAPLAADIATAYAAAEAAAAASGARRKNINILEIASKIFGE